MNESAQLLNLMPFNQFTFCANILTPSLCYFLLLTNVAHLLTHSILFGGPPSLPFFFFTARPMADIYSDGPFFPLSLLILSQLVLHLLVYPPTHPSTLFFLEKEEERKLWSFKVVWSA